MKLKEIIFISKKLNSQIKHGKFYRFVSIISIVSVMLGSMALLLSMSVLDGFENKLAETAINFTSHIKIYKNGGNYINNYNYVKSHLLNQVQGIKSINPYLQKEALISTKYDVDGVILKGISINDNSTGIIDKIVKDRINSENIDSKININSNDNKQKSALNGIIIGERLASKLNVKIGDSLIVYLMPSSNVDYDLLPNPVTGNNNRNSSSTFPDLFKLEIGNIYNTGMAQYDENVVYCDINMLYSLLNLDISSASGFDIMLNDTKEIEEISTKIRAILKFPYFIINVFELHSSMFAWIEMQKKPIPLVLALISLVAVMNIITILLILIVEKTHTIGILRTLGMKSSNIIAIFLSKGTFIGLIGTLLGALFAYIISYLQIHFELIKLNGEIYFLDVLPISINFQNYLIVIFMSLLLSFFVTLIPALISLKVTPIKAINFK